MFLQDVWQDVEQKFCTTKLPKYIETNELTIQARQETEKWENHRERNKHFKFCSLISNSGPVGRKWLIQNTLTKLKTWVPFR